MKPTQWNIDPAYVAPEWSWFWEHAAHVIPLWEGGGNPVDVVTGKEGVLTLETSPDTGTVTWIPDGIQFSSDDSNQWEWDLNLDATKDRYAFVTYFWCNAGSGDNNICGMEDQSASTYITTGWRGSGWGFFSNSQTSQTGGARAPVPKLCMLVGVRDNGEWRLYDNGVVNLQYSNGYTGAANLDKFFVGTTTSFTGRPSYNGPIYWSALLDTVPTDSQIRQLTSDPFGPFRHYRDTSPGPYQYNEFVPPSSDSFEVHTPTKPQMWNVDPAFVTPNYQWFWEYNVTAAVAFLGPNNVKAELVHGKDLQMGAAASLDLHEGYGWGVDCTGGAGDNGARIPSDPAYDVTGDLTMVWYGIVDANVGSGVNILMCTYENVSPYEGDLLGIYTGTPNKFIRFFRGDGTASTTPKETGAVIVPGEPVVIIVRHRVSNNAYTIHLNGVNVANNNTYPRTPVGGGHGFHLGSSSDNALKSDSHHFAAYMLNDFISDDQVQQLTKDPYGPVRHYRDTSPGPYQYFNPEVSRLETIRPPNKPVPWSM